MNYKAKRYRSGLTTYTIAKELGIDWRKYQDVESRKINLEGEYLDKFIKITEPKNAKMIRFNRNQRIRDIKTFIKEGKLKELMAKRNYNAMTLARILDFDATTMNQILNGTYSSDDTNEFVYDFLNNPINAYVDESEIKIQESDTDASDKERYTDDDIYKELKRLKEEKGFSCQEISEATGVATSTISHTLSGRKTKDKTIKKIYEFLSNGTKVDSKAQITHLENILMEKKISKMDVARALKINYSYVYNFLKGNNIRKDYQNLILDYIENVEGKKVNVKEPFEMNLKEIDTLMKDKGISYHAICEALNISYSYLEKLLNDRVIGCYETKRKLDEFVRNYEPQVEKTEDSENEEKIVPISTLDEMMNEPEVGDICIEEEDDEEDEDDLDEDIDFEDVIADGVLSLDKDYFDLLKENKELKDQLAKVQKQLSSYETLIEVIKGLQK